MMTPAGPTPGGFHCFCPGASNVNTSRRRWSWTAFAVGLAVGIPVGVVGLIVLAQILTVMTALP